MSNDREEILKFSVAKNDSADVTAKTTGHFDTLDTASKLEAWLQVLQTAEAAVQQLSVDLSKETKQPLEKL